MTYSTSGSVQKLAGCLETELRSMGYDPALAHDFTILSTPTDGSVSRHRVLIVVELRDDGRAASA